MEIDLEDRPERFQVLKIEGTVRLSTERIETETLAPNWINDTTLTQDIGDRWLVEQRSLLLEVPSALVPETWNVLANPKHAEATLLQIMATYE